jgi:hypothetical protein
MDAALPAFDLVRAACGFRNIGDPVEWMPNDKSELPAP